MDKYRKAIASVIMATFIAIIPIVNAGPMTVISKLLIIVAFTSAALVYFVPNVPHAPVVKTIVAAFMAGLAFLVTVVDAKCPSLSHIVTCVAVVNWMQCGVMVLKAAGVYLIPNVPPVTPA